MSELQFPPQNPIENRLLAALPTQEYQRLVPYLEGVSFSIKQPIYEAGEPIEYVYFPTQGLISIVTAMEDGSVIEVGW